MNASARKSSFEGRLLDWGIQQAERLYPARIAWPISTLGIIGAGFTGSRIAQLAWQAGCRLVVVDSEPEALDRLSQRLACCRSTPSMGQAHPRSGGKTFMALSEGGFADPPSADQQASPAQPMLTQQLAPLAFCDLVLECVPENMYLKREILARVESLLKPQAILTTNTSTIPLSRLADGLKRPQQFCGIHFFMPIPHRPVVEVVRGWSSSARTLASAIGFVRRLGLVPLVAEDGVGFLVNRLLLAWLNEALQLLEEGHRPLEIDRQAQEFGWALGPFALMDWIGLDVVLAGAWQLAELFADRLVRSEVLVRMVKKGQLGRKTGMGFYRYPSSDPANPQAETEHLEPNPDLLLPEGSPSPTAGFPPPYETAIPNPPPLPNDLREKALSRENPQAEETPGIRSAPRGDSSGRREDGIVISLPRGLTSSPATWVDRLHAAILVEVEQMIQEGRLEDPRQVDLALVGALGFPAPFGGLLAWADQIGLDRLLQQTLNCPQASFRRHDAYRRLWERANTQKKYYPNRPDQK